MNKRKKSIAEIEAEEEETENEDERSGILKDGERVRVSLLMRDGAINPDLLPHQRAKALAAQQPLVSDGSSNPMAMHKPGFRYLTDANRRAIGDAAKAAAYQQADAADREAWRNPAVRLDYNEYGGDEPRNTGTGAPAKGSAAPAGAYPLSAGEGSACSIDGGPGTLVRQGNWLVCKPSRSQDAAIDAKQAAYEAYDREMAVAYLRK